MIEFMCSIPSTSFFSLIHAEMLPRHVLLSADNLLLSLMHAVLLPMKSLQLSPLPYRSEWVIIGASAMAVDGAIYPWKDLIVSPYRERVE